MRLVTRAYTITILFFCVGSLILFLEADAVKEQPQSTVNINNNQNIKRSRYFDEYDDPQANLLALELAATSSEQDHDKQKIKTTAEKISSFIKDIKNKVQKGNEPIKSPEELEKNPFAKSDVATKSQQTTAAQSKDNISIRILPNASKKFVAFLFVIFAIAVFSTYYVITSRKEGKRSENKSAVLKKQNKTTVAVADDGTINIKHNNINNNNNEKTSVKPKRSVIIQDLDASKNDGENTDNNTNINNIDNKNEIKKEELHEETDPKEEPHDDLANDTNEATNEKRSKNSSKDETTDNSVNEKSNKDEQQISPRRKVQISPRVTEPDEHHLASDDDEHGQDPEYEEDVHEKIVLSSSSSQIRAKKNSPRVHEINTEIAEHQHTIQLLERETTPDNAIKIRELKMFVTDLKLRKMEIEEKMASNALSFEQIKEMQRQNKFKRKAKREEISKSSEYRNTKTMLTEKQNHIQSQSLKLKGEKNEREVAEQKRRHEKELHEMMWNEFIFVMKVTLVIFVVFWGIHLWQTMSFSVIVSLVRQKFGEFVEYLLPSTTRNLSFLSKVPVVGAFLSGAGSFLGILFLLLGFVAYAVGFYFIGSYFANTLLLTLVMLGFGAWRHVVTGGMTFVTLASIEYVVIRQLKHYMNSPKYSLIYIPFVIFAAVLGYFTAFNVVSIDVPIQVAANSSLVNNVWSRVSKLVFK